MARSRYLIVMATVTAALASRQVAWAKPVATTQQAVATDWDARAPWKIAPEGVKSAADQNADLLLALLDANDRGALTTAQVHLACANHILAQARLVSTAGRNRELVVKQPPLHLTSVAASRWLIGVATEEDLGQLAAAAEEARDHIAKARNHLEQDAKVDVDGDHKTKRAQLKYAATTLSALTEIYASADTNLDNAGRKRLRRAALRLAAARESDDAGLASAARIWQAMAWHRGNRSKRALATLPDALSPPGENSYAFFSQLLRCRVLTDNGQHAIAMMLTYRLEAMCKVWSDNRPFDELERRHRLLRLLQWDIAHRWLAELRDAGESAAADQLRATMARTRKVIDEDPEPYNVYRLQSAIPFLVALPEDVKTKPAATQPTTDQE